MQKQARRHLGDVIIATPLSFWAITALLAAIMALFFTFVLTTDYSRTAELSGTLKNNTQNNEIIAEFKVAPALADKLQTGQNVRLFYEGYAYQDFGVQHGDIIDISPSANPDITILVRPDISSENAISSGADITLRPGMIVTGDVTLETQKLWKLAFRARADEAP